MQNLKAKEKSDMGQNQTFAFCTTDFYATFQKSFVSFPRTLFSVLFGSL